MNACLWTPAYGRLLMDACLWTPAYGRLLMKILMFRHFCQDFFIEITQIRGVRIHVYIYRPFPKKNQTKNESFEAQKIGNVKKYSKNNAFPNINKVVSLREISPKMNASETNKSYLYAVKMRASKGDIHLSGAERLVEKKQILPASQSLLKRALNHGNGNADAVHLKVEAIECSEVLKVPSLSVTEADASNPAEAFSVLGRLLKENGIDDAESCLSLLKNASPMRGAMLVDIRTLQRCEPDPERGVRATYMDGEKTCFDTGKNHFREALILATKVSSAPYIVGELCISDDCNYTTGYFASKKSGYVRIPNLKAHGDPHGGRLFLYDGTSEEDLKETLAYLEHQAVVVTNLPMDVSLPVFDVRQRLKALKEKHLYRTETVIEAVESDRVRIDGRWYVSFTSNDYLGFSQHPEVKSSAVRALEQYGVGSGGSRLMCGTFELHRQLEQLIADFTGHEAAMVFNSGFAANVSILPALFGEGDVIFSDALNHASLIDGCRLCKAQTVIYRHNDMSDLEEKLRSTSFKHAVIVSDAIFSMDGDIADGTVLSEFAEKYHALLYIDEAHATGVLGEHGCGFKEHFHFQPKPSYLCMGSLSKAIGVEGGFVAGSAEVIDYLRNTARGYIFSTSLPAPSVAAAIKSFQLLQAPSRYVEALRKNIALLNSLCRQFNLPMTAETPIVSCEVGSEETAILLSERLFEEGFFVKAVRYPTVAKGAAWLRITITALHTHEHLERFAQTLAGLLKEMTVKN